MHHIYLRLHQRETIADAFPRSYSKGYVHVGIDLVLIFRAEPFGVELLRLREVLGIVVQGVNGDPNGIVRI